MNSWPKSRPRTRASRSSTRPFTKSSNRSSRFSTSNPEYRKAKILERIVEPERVIMFRVPWVDDKGEVQVNRGYRVEFNSAIGPYKGGLRFHPTRQPRHPEVPRLRAGLQEPPHHAAHGRRQGRLATSIPRASRDNEVMRFCQRFMTELFRHIGADTDVPAGDIGVGGREIGFMFGQYKRLRNEFTGVLTGKGLELGRLAHPSRGHRLRRRLLRRGDARDPRRQASRARPAPSPARATSPSTRSRRSTSSAARPSPCPTPTARSTTRTASTPRSWPSSWT